jgi:hypothetical protein
VKPVVDVAPDWESYEYKAIDLKDDAQKAFFEAAMAWDLEIDGKKWADGKNVSLTVVVPDVNANPALSSSDQCIRLVVSPCMCTYLQHIAFCLCTTLLSSAQFVELRASVYDPRPTLIPSSLSAETQATAD